MRLESETFHEFEILAAVDSCGGQHVVCDGCIRAALECSFALIAEYATTACKTDERFRVDESVNCHDAAEFVVGKLRQAFVGRAGNRV